MLTKTLSLSYFPLSLSGMIKIAESRLVGGGVSLIHPSMGSQFLKQESESNKLGFEF